MERRNKLSSTPSTGPVNQARVFQQPTILLPPLPPPDVPPPDVPPPKTSPKLIAKRIKEPRKNKNHEFVMPPTKDHTSKYNYSRSYSNNEMSMSARVYQQATNLMPPTPPHSPTGMGAPPFSNKNSNICSRQNSQNNGKYS